jgi:tetratricopeptide (TPR) repeat protein
LSALDPELAIIAGRVDLLVARVREAKTIAERRFALDALARGLLCADPGSVDRALRDEVIALRVDPSTVAAAERERLPHAVGIPLVARDLGFVRQVHVAYDPVGLADDDFLDEEARRAVAQAIETAARTAPPPRGDPSRHRLFAVQPHAFRHARVEGRSLSCAAFVSATALWTGRPVRAGAVVTGELAGDRVLPVGAIEAKVRAAIAHRAEVLVVPAANRAAAVSCAGSSIEIVAVADARALLDATLHASPAPRTSPDRKVAEAREASEKAWNGYRWPSVRERLVHLSSTLPSYRLDLRVEVLARLAAAQRHLGDPAGSLELLREAENLVRSDEGRRSVPDAPIAYLYMQRAMTERQLSHFAAASRAAERAVAVARGARLRRELTKALGCLGLVALARRRPDRAIAAFEESLEVVLRHEPERAARTHAYLIEAHAAAGDETRARMHFEAAMRDVDGGDDGDRRSRESWVRTSWGGALVALGRPHAAVEVLEAPAVAASLEEEPLPGLLARRHLGIALVRAGQLARGLELLAASPVVHGRALAPHLALAASLNVLFEARERIATGAWGKDIAGRARRALEHVPRTGSAGAFLGRALEGTRALLERDPPRSTKDIDVLLERCVRLG